MKCIVVTPEKTVLEKEATFVVVPLYDGEYGIALGHTPVVGRLGAGELRIESKDGNETWFVQGGFVEVLNNVVTLLTQRAVEINRLKVADAEKALEAAMAKPVQTDELFLARSAAVDAARNELRSAKKVAH